MTLLAFLLFALGTMASAQSFSVVQELRDGVRIVRLEDRARNLTVSVAPSLGNNAFEFLANGRNVMWFPFESVAAFAEAPRLVGNPLLWPWANRLDSDGFFANGKRYELQPNLVSLRRDGSGLPIHGLLMFSDRWRVVAAEADERSASVTSRLEFSRYPDLMAQFPFAHTFEMTYELADGALEVRMRIENRSAEPLPLSLGFHPYFQVHDAPREDWTVTIPARRVWELDETLLPTGETAAAADRLPDLPALRLGQTRLDHVFGGLVRTGDGLAVFRLAGKQQKIEVSFGEKYPIAVVYAPDRAFVCFEPMTAITNGANLAQIGRYAAFPTVPAGSVWQESYFIRPTGF